MNDADGNVNDFGHSHPLFPLGPLLLIFHCPTLLLTISKRLCTYTIPLLARNAATKTVSRLRLRLHLSLPLSPLYYSWTTAVCGELIADTRHPLRLTLHIRRSTTDLVSASLRFRSLTLHLSFNYLSSPGTLASTSDSSSKPRIAP